MENLRACVVKKGSGMTEPQRKGRYTVARIAGV
ncbi:MAG: 30S ribosomal protein S13, partial [Rhodobacteraceae bacterium]|nr:30S ribosomal protein S13 [Paracoccaceae bacterium]